jgi:hypothetical protein
LKIGEKPSYLYPEPLSAYWTICCCGWQYSMNLKSFQSTWW